MHEQEGTAVSRSTVHTKVTEEIIAAIAAGSPKFEMPWVSAAAAAPPSLSGAIAGRSHGADSAPAARPSTWRRDSEGLRGGRLKSVRPSWPPWRHPTTR